MINKIQAPEELDTKNGRIKNLRVYHNPSLGRFFINYDNPQSKNVGRKADKKDYTFDNKFHIIVDKCENPNISEKWVADLENKQRLPVEAKDILNSIECLTTTSSRFRHQ